MSQFRHTANRTRELALALEIMQRQNGHRILLIEAASGYGKTHLLAQIRRDCDALLPKPMLISLDLKASEGGVESVFATIYSQLERKCEYLNLDIAAIFAAYHAQTEQQTAYRLSINVNVNRNLIWGKQDVVIQLPEEGRQQLARMDMEREREFFKAVSRLNAQHPLVLVVDNVNILENDLERWVCNTLLAQIEQMPSLALIVAGHQMPAPSHIWEECCQRIDLEPIADVDVWVDWIGKQGLSLTREQVEPLVFCLKGQPQQTSQTLLAFAKTKQVAGARR